MPVVIPVRGAAGEDVGRVCAVCQTKIAASERVGPCPSCAALFHEECWNDNGGCAIYGCERAPRTVKGTEQLTPRSYWGQEEKQCPQCRSMIKVAAIRCRYCGAMFESAEPVSGTEVRRRRQLEPKLEAARKISVALFVVGLIPCLAPIGAIAGSIWYHRNRDLIRKLPGQNRVFCYVGLLAAVVCTVADLLVILIV